jgi:hypothetical protein
VLWVVRDFLSHWTPEQLGDLPADCRPGQMARAEEVAEYAMQLRHTQGRSDDIPASRLYILTTFFGLAAQRLAQIAHWEAHLRKSQTEKQ